MGRREVDEQRGAERKGSRVSCVYWFSDSRRVARSCPKRSGSGRNPFAPLFFFSNHLSCVYLSSGPPETPGACVATCKSRRQLLQLRVSAIWCRVLLGFVPEGAEIHQQRLIDVNKLSALMLRPLILCLHVGSHHFDKQTNGGQQMPSVDAVRHINRLHLIKVPKGRRRSVTNSLAFWIPPNLLEMVTSMNPYTYPNKLLEVSGSRSTRERRSHKHKVVKWKALEDTWTVSRFFFHYTHKIGRWRRRLLMGQRSPSGISRDEKSGRRKRSIGIDWIPR